MKSPQVEELWMTQTMEALVVREPNVLDIEETPVPEPGRHEVLARVRSVSICGTDAHLIRGDYPGFWPLAFPFTPGHEWAGDLVTLGPGAEAYGWKVGDRVAGTSHNACGACQKCVEGRYNLCENYGKPGLHAQYGHNTQGVNATYAVHNVKCIFALPDSVSYDEGAVVDPASIALHVARRGNIQPGDTIAVTGAGAVGLLASDAAVICGAARVIVVGRGYRLEKAASWGYETVDSTAGDPDRTAGSYGGGRYLLDTAKGADLGARDARLVVDLNFLYHPSCRYDDAWLCPLAPPENSVAARVEAGERMA